MSTFPLVVSSMFSFGRKNKSYGKSTGKMIDPSDRELLFIRRGSAFVRRIGQHNSQNYHSGFWNFRRTFTKVIFLYLFARVIYPLVMSFSFSAWLLSLFLLSVCHCIVWPCVWYFTDRYLCLVTSIAGTKFRYTCKASCQLA